MEDGEVQYVLDILEEDQIGLLSEDDEFLYNTYQAYDDLTRELARAQGDSSVEQLASDLRKLVMDPLKVEAVNADTVTVTPNPLMIIFGPDPHAAGDDAGAQGELLEGAARCAAYG